MDAQEIVNGLCAEWSDPEFGPSDEALYLDTEDPPAIGHTAHVKFDEWHRLPTLTLTLASVRCTGCPPLP